MRSLFTPALLALLGCAGDPLLDRIATDTVTHDHLRLHTRFALVPFRDAPMPVYLRVGTDGVADTLVGATSPASARVMFHGGGMAALEALAVPRDGELVLAPGTTHLMLEPPLSRRFGRGDSVEVLLHFAHAGAVRVMVPVIDYAEVDALER